MSRSYSHHQLARSPLGRALEYYIQNGMAPNFLRRLTFRLCYWYQFVTGRQTTALDVHIYRRTRTALEELRYAYTIWQRHRYPCRCGCEANNTDLGAFSAMVTRLRDQGWLGEDSEDDFSTDDGYLDDFPVFHERRDLRAMADARRTRRERWGANQQGNILPGSLTDERGRRPSRELSANESLSVLTQFGSQRREETINSRSRSSPPDPPTEQRNSSALSSTDSGRLGGRFADRASNDRGSRRNFLSTISNHGCHSRNISTASLMSQIMGCSDANWSNLIRRARASSDISRRTSRRSRDSLTNGGGMRRSPNLATAQRMGRGSHAPSMIHRRRRSGSLDSSMAERGRLPIAPGIDGLRLIEQLTMIAQTEDSPLSTSARDLLIEFQARPPTHDDRIIEIAHLWHRITWLINQAQAEEGELQGA